MNRQAPFALGIAALLSVATLVAGSPTAAPVPEPTVSTDDRMESLCNDSLPEMQTVGGLRNVAMAIRIPKSRKWSSNLAAAKKSSSRIIGDEFKKSFKAKLSLTHGGLTCQYPVKVRLSGDWKDHISLDQGVPVASMDVQMDAGNVGGIVDFKLLLPATRGTDNELVITALMRRLGIMAPRTQAVSVNVNGTDVNYLFQENIVKEMVEFNHRREAPLYEADESLMWEERQANGENRDTDVRYVLARMSNSKWVGTSDNRAKIAKVGLDALMSVYAAAWNRQGIRTDLLTFGDTAAQQRFDTYASVMSAAGAFHGLIGHNRRFYFDPMHGYFEPVYYDGDATFVYGGKLTATPSLAARRGAAHALAQLRALDRSVLWEDVTASGSTITRAQFDAAMDLMDTRLRDFAAQGAPQQSTVKFRAGNFADLQQRDRVLVFATDRKHVTVCDFTVTDCADESLSKSDFAALLAGKLTRDDLRYMYLGAQLAPYRDGTSPDVRPSNATSVIAFADGARLLSYGGTTPTVDRRTKTIVIGDAAPGTYVYITGGRIDGWTITYQGQTGDSAALEDRFNDQELTGCLTLSDTVVTKVTVISHTSRCEDGVNFVRVDGDVDLLDISDAQQDAFDADFTNVTFRKVVVDQAGNDCVDVSSGDYAYGAALLSGCHDKGVSVGERAAVHFDTVNVVDATIGYAAKDWSTLTIRDGTAREVQVCASAYRKKQEFGAATVALTTLDCPIGVLTPATRSSITVGP